MKVWLDCGDDYGPPRDYTAQVRHYSHVLCVALGTCMDLELLSPHTHVAADCSDGAVCEVASGIALL